MPYEKHTLLRYLNDQEIEAQNALALIPESCEEPRKLLNMRLGSLQDFRKFIDSMDFKDDYRALWERYYTGWRP